MQNTNGQLPISQWAITHVTAPIAMGMIPSMTDAWKHRLLGLLEARNTNMKAASLGAGLGETFVRDILKRGRTPSAEHLERLARFLGSSVSELMLDPSSEQKRVPLGQEFEPDPEFDDGTRHSIDSDDLSKLGVSTIRPFAGDIPGSSPDIDTSAGAGPGGLPAPSVLPTGEVVYSADAVRGEILMPDYLLSEFTRAKAPRVHWIKVRGDSMEPTLLPGERVMVDTTDQQFGQGGVFVIRDPDGEILVKRLRKLKDGEIELVSDNPKQPPMVHRADEIGILGRVVGRLARL